MLINYLLIPIVLGVSVQALGHEDLVSVSIPTITEALRFAKSQSIRKYMNVSLDPCEDFYQFACGNWRTHHPATKYYQQTSGFSISRDDFDRILVQFLSEPQDNYTSSERTVKNFYDSCRNLPLYDPSEYRQNIKKLIKEFGRMPALEGTKWQHEDFDWVKTIGDIAYKYDIGIIYGYSLSNFHPDPTAKVLVMKSHLMVYNPDFSAEAITTYKSNVETTLENLLGVEPKTAKQTAKEIVDFGIKLWKANQTDTKSSETTFDEMQQKYSRILDVMKLVNASFGYIPAGVVVEENPSYVEALATIVKKTPKRVLANYIFFALMVQFKLYRFPNYEYQSDFCLQMTKDYFLPVLSKMVYRPSHLKEPEQEFHRMWQGITATLQNILESNQLSWFDDESREAAIEKLHLMKYYIASYEDMNLDELYKELTLNGSDFRENIKSIKSYNARQSRKLLNGQRDNKHSNIGDVIATYMRTANVVRFPISSLLTDYMWSKFAPHAFNYARLGYVIAHEIMHGFSGHGRHYNKLGASIDWIYKDIKERYEERRQCYYDQYHNFTLDNKPLPQHSAQAENIADNGGIYLAYHAYLKWLADEARTQEELGLETLPHLDYTNKQLFFIGYSQFWCSDTHADLRGQRTSNDVHSPKEFRAIVPLLNFGEFAKEFNCPSGSSMNPRKKCSIY